MLFKNQIVEKYQTLSFGEVIKQLRKMLLQSYFTTSDMYITDCHYNFSFVVENDAQHLPISNLKIYYYLLCYFSSKFEVQYYLCKTV